MYRAYDAQAQWRVTHGSDKPLPLLQVQVYTDGSNTPHQWDPIRRSWVEVWASLYQRTLGRLAFVAPANLKDPMVLQALPRRSRRAVDVRNPDLLFVCPSLNLELGGIEITAHSPDGSNIEKRYPFAWAARREQLWAIIATPYEKHRPGGQVNRLPHRTARRNRALAAEWDPQDPLSALVQILPLRSLADRPDKVDEQIQQLQMDWPDLGTLMAHRLALAAGATGAEYATACAGLIDAKRRLLALHQRAAWLTSLTMPSTLMLLDDRVVQTYNCRPESGHWERGEGQFDSIDGRLMTTLDDLALFDAESAGKPFEFWLPQLVRGHAWVAEQEARSFPSKRFRNVMVTLAPLVVTRFADDLSPDDWRLLQEHPRMCLERDDRWKPDVYRVTDAVGLIDRDRVAGDGLSKVPATTRSEIRTLLDDDDLLYSSHRAYIGGWKDDLRAAIVGMPKHATVIVPRIPEHLLSDLGSPARIVGAEGCSRLQLMMLRQLHRSPLAEVVPVSLRH